MSLRTRFERDGYAIARDLVPPERLAELERAFDKLMQRANPTEALLQRPAPSSSSPAFARHLRDPACAGLATEALGPTSVQLLQDGLLLKRPQAGSRIEWHQDYSYTGYLVPARTVSVRLALTPSTLETGCLHVLAGSHRWAADAAIDVFGDTIGAGALDALPEPWRSRSQEATRTVELQPGDVSLHHCRTYHSSPDNRGSQSAKLFVVHVLDSACRLDPQRLPNEEARAWFTTDLHGHLSTDRFPRLS